jgi:AGCS family alanine or glycine:cation symporter
VAGGTLGSVILIGVQRGAYSNEAGIGTEALAHGAVRTSEPIREGLVAMVGPIIDTLIICSATAFMILLSGVWLTSDANGVTLTANAFSQLLGPAGTVIIFVCVVCFSGTTLLTYSYYGAKCFSFLFGADRQHWYGFLYVGFIVVAAVVTLEAAIGVIDGAFAIMAIPTMVSTLLLAPRVKVAADRYFASLRG